MMERVKRLTRHDGVVRGVKHVRLGLAGLAVVNWSSRSRASVSAAQRRRSTLRMLRI
jgi:hypothetical protein